jgi:hypothetical protein
LPARPALWFHRAVERSAWRRRTALSRAAVPRKCLVVGRGRNKEKKKKKKKKNIWFTFVTGAEIIGIVVVRVQNLKVCVFWVK